MEVLDRKLPRRGICPMLVADSTLRKFNIAEVKTDLVISQEDLSKRLMSAEYVFPIMVNRKKAMEAYILGY